MKKERNIAIKRPWNNKTRFIAVVPYYSIILLLLLTFINTNSAFPQGKPEPLSVAKSDIDSLIKSSDLFERFDGARLLCSATDFDTTWAYETIIEGIAIENEKLKDTGFHFKYFRINPDRIFPIYIEGLAAISKNSPGRLRQYTMSLSGEMKEWLTVALGFLTDKSAHEDVREIISTTSNIILKANAIRAISEYRDTSDVPLLIATLSDTLSIIEIDEPMAGMTDIFPSYNPVIESTRYALNKLGYRSNWDENGNPIVTKKE